MADPAWQDGEFRALNVRSENLCILAGRSNWIGGAYDNLHGDRDLLQTLRCKRPSHSGSDGEDGSDAWIAIGIAGVLKGLLHVGLLPDRLKLFHLIRHLRRIASVLLFVAPGQKPLQVGSCAIMVYPP